MPAKTVTKLKRAKTPESVGVSSKAIAELLEDFEQTDVEVHSLMILRHGKVAYESWAEPFSPDMPHIMYSVSKSFISTAIGFAIEEGLLTLETRVIDIFPEFAPKKTDEKLEKLNIYHLLTMTAGKDPSVLTDRTKNQWIKDFMNAPWIFTPGESWKYISENQFMLSAILNKLTGQSVRDYLQPRLFEPLGIEYPYWETDGNNVEAGGWGLFITTEELANFTQCYANKGKWGRKQVIPKKWVEFATSNLEDNSGPNTDSDSIVGYGACFWQIGGARGFRADGMFSQFGIVCEDYDACIVMTACEITEQKTRDCIWRHFPEGFFDEENPPEDVIEAPKLKPLVELPKSKISSPNQEILETKNIEIKPKKTLEAANFPLSVLPLFAVFMSTDKAGYFNNFRFGFSENECTMSWDEQDEHNTITCGMDGKPRFSPMHLGGVDYTASATACWVNENNFFVWVRPLGAVGQRRLRFEFHADGSVTLHPSSFQNMHYVGNDLSLSYVGLAKTALVKNIITFSFSKVIPAVAEPKHNCVITDRDE